jgi:hypothetical protein
MARLRDRYHRLSGGAVADSVALADIAEQSDDATRSLARRNVAYPQAVAIRIHEVNLPAPRLREYLAPELLSDGIKIAYSKAHEGVRFGVTRVLGQEQPGASVPRDRDEGGKAWLKPVFPLLRIAQTSIPRGRRRCINDPKDWYGFFHHPRMTPASRRGGRRRMDLARSRADRRARTKVDRRRNRDRWLIHMARQLLG